MRVATRQSSASLSRGAVACGDGGNNEITGPTNRIPSVRRELFRHHLRHVS